MNAAIADILPVFGDCVERSLLCTDNVSCTSEYRLPLRPKVETKLNNKVKFQTASVSRCLPRSSGVRSFVLPKNELRCFSATTVHMSWFTWYHNTTIKNSNSQTSVSARLENNILLTLLYLLTIYKSHTHVTRCIFGLVAKCLFHSTAAPHRTQSVLGWVTVCRWVIHHRLLYYHKILLLQF